MFYFDGENETQNRNDTEWNERAARREWMEIKEITRDETNYPSYPITENETSWYWQQEKDPFFNSIQFNSIQETGCHKRQQSFSGYEDLFVMFFISEFKEINNAIHITKYTKAKKKIKWNIKWKIK